MKNKAKLFGIYLPVFAVLLLAALALRTVALFLDFDFNTGYFAEKTLTRISDYITLSAAIFFFTYVFTARRDMKLIPDFTSPATYIPTGIVAISIVFLIKSLIGKALEIDAFIEVLTELAKNNSEQAITQLPTQKLFLGIVIITAVLAALSIIHFVLTALIEKNSSTKRASYGIFTVLFLSFYGIFLYFNADLPINAPNKMLDQMTYLLAAVFFLYETRLSLGREKWRAYIAFGFISSFVGIYTSLPAIIIYFAKGAAIANTVYESALTLALSTFILSRILLTGELIEDKDSSTVLALMQFANARDAILNPVSDTSDVIEISGETLADSELDEETDTNQLTIEDVATYPNEETENTAPADETAEKQAELSEETSSSAGESEEIREESPEAEALPQETAIDPTTPIAESKNDAEDASSEEAE